MFLYDGKPTRATWPGGKGFGPNDASQAFVVVLGEGLVEGIRATRQKERSSQEPIGEVTAEPVRLSEFGVRFTFNVDGAAIALTPDQARTLGLAATPDYGVPPLFVAADLPEGAELADKKFQDEIEDPFVWVWPSKGPGIAGVLGVKTQHGVRLVVEVRGNETRTVGPRDWHEPAIRQHLQRAGVV